MVMDILHGTALPRARVRVKARVPDMMAKEEVKVSARALVARVQEAKVHGHQQEAAGLVEAVTSNLIVQKAKAKAAREVPALWRSGTLIRKPKDIFGHWQLSLLQLRWNPYTL